MKKEIIAYAITHAPRGVKGGPYEAPRQAYGVGTAALSGAEMWTFRPLVALGFVRHHVPHARVIRIVRKGRPPETSAVEVLRDMLATWDDRGFIRTEAFARARAVLAASGPDPSAALERAERAERERDEARSRGGGDVVDALARLREESADNAKLRAELARLTAPAEEPRIVPGKQPAKDRATDEELCDLYEAAWDACPGNASESKLAALRAVAAHVRKERCLERQIRKLSQDGYATIIGAVDGGTGCADVTIRGPANFHAHARTDIGASDLHATLARLLGESR